MPDDELTPTDRALLSACRHMVATCPICRTAHTWDDCARELIPRYRSGLCRVCRADLTPILRRHLAECPDAAARRIKLNGPPETE